MHRHPDLRRNTGSANQVKTLAPQTGTPRPPRHTFKKGLSLGRRLYVKPHPIQVRQQGFQTVWVGQVQSFQPVVMIADELFDRLQDQAYDEAGDYCIGWLDHVTKEDQDELNDAIETVFFAWMKAHPEYKPNFFTIADSQSYKVGDEK